jgi:hypothetical protein
MSDISSVSRSPSGSPMRIDFDPQNVDQCRAVLKIIDAIHRIDFTMKDDPRSMYVYCWNESSNRLRLDLAHPGLA